MLKRILAISITLLFIIPVFVLAHQPRIVEESFTLIENPEVSQAFYGELKGQPDYYQIQIEYPIKLYVGILLPDVKDIDKDVSVEISKGDKFYHLLDGVSFEWQPFYEEFAGDNYFKGPEFSAGEESGDYTLKVFSPDNQGKYVLVVGEKEEFPFNEMINTLVSLPRLKKFFDKSPWQALTAPIILRFIVLPIVLLIAIIFVIFFLVRRRRRNKENKNE